MIKREEEILNAAEEYATGSPQATLRYKAFKDGAEWADAHPNWHSVEENPTKQNIYLVRVEVGDWDVSRSYKFAKYELAPYAEHRGVMKWHTLGFSYSNSRITHWMEIPDIAQYRNPVKKQTIWKNASQTPSEKSEIVLIDTNGEWYNISYSFDEYDDAFGKGWESCVRTYNIDKWAYLDDLINL